MKNLLIKTLSLSLLVSTFGFISACGGGATTAQQPNPTNAPPRTDPGDDQIIYTGPTAANDDVQAFKINVWDNLTADNRCGSCHNENSEGQIESLMFMRRDNINLAYETIMPYVDRVAPVLSTLVTKVQSGHNAWDPSAADTIQNLIQRWSTASGASENVIVLTAPDYREVGKTKQFPASATAGDDASFANTIYALVTDTDSANCVACHSEASAARQQPFFASANVDTAYLAARNLIDLNSPNNSRFVQRMQENHNVWVHPTGAMSPSAYSVQEMRSAVSLFANAIQAVEVNPNLRVSQAVGIVDDGVVASSGGRIETNVIALYQFKEGVGAIAYDTSGVAPALNLNLSPGVEWVGSWGIRIGDNGKAQGNTVASKKLHDEIKRTGEYSIEAWVIPANVTQEDARIVTYSGSTDERNFSLHQTLYDYDFLARTENTNINGMPMLSTPSADELLQATLQHVVVTYSQIDGRRIYVNGELEAQDTQLVGNLNDWDDSYVLAVGNEVDNARWWNGTVRLLAIHNRVLTPTQVSTNFEAGVGQKYYLLFGVSHLVDMPQAYVVFAVEVYDDYSYLFSSPFFISLDRDAVPEEAIDISGIRIGINGKEAAISQAFANVNASVTAQNYDSGVGTSLSTSPVGTLIALEDGPIGDLFFLSFDRIGNSTYTRPPEPSPAPITRVAADTQPDFGIRLFDEVFQNMSAITTVPSARVYDFYVAEIRRSLPGSETLSGFLSSQQSAITQLALAYCTELVTDSTLRTAYFGNFGTLSTPEQQNALIDPLLNRMLIRGDGSFGFTAHPNAASIKPQLVDLMTNGLTTNDQNTKAIAVCTSALASAAMLMQ